MTHHKRYRMSKFGDIYVLRKKNMQYLRGAFWIFLGTPSRSIIIDLKNIYYWFQSCIQKCNYFGRYAPYYSSAVLKNWVEIVDYKL